MKISDENHDAVAAELRRAVLILMGGHGIPLHEILIVAHAWSISELANNFGPAVATECAAASIKRLESVPVTPQLATRDGVPVRSIQ